MEPDVLSLRASACLSGGRLRGRRRGAGAFRAFPRVGRRRRPCPPPRGRRRLGKSPFVPRKSGQSRVIGYLADSPRASIFWVPIFRFSTLTPSVLPPRGAPHETLKEVYICIGIQLSRSDAGLQGKKQALGRIGSSVSRCGTARREVNRVSRQDTFNLRRRSIRGASSTDCRNSRPSRSTSLLARGNA